MKKERKTVTLARFQQNTGQIDWLPKNPRQWTQTDIDRTVKSIEEDTDFLEDRPLLAVENGDKLVVFAGNLRLTAVRKTDQKAVPVVVYSPESDEDQETIKRRALKDNGSFGSWDYDTLANEWDGPFEDWGITVPDWDDGKSSAGGHPGQSGAQEDDFEEEKDEVKTRCKPGDIWQLGEHRLMCGDSSDAQCVKKLMDGVFADMVFTDPPYGVAIGDKNKTLQSVQPSGRIEANIANDTLPVEKLHDLLLKAMVNAREACKDDASYYVCAPPGGDMGLMMMMMKDAGLNVRHQIVWNKSSATFSLGRLDYDYKHESILYTWTKSHHNYRNGPFRTSVWDIEKPRKCDLHPTMKPVELVSAAILDGTQIGDVVLDVFGGSGTTIIASEQLGRKARLMEIDPHYCDVIIARWEKLSVGKAIKIHNT